MRIGLIVVLALIAINLCLGQTQPAPDVGTVAPDFTLPYATRDSIARTPLTLSKIVGSRTIVIAFYPADWSGGCTKEMCTMRDNFGSLQSLDAEVLPISGDYVFAHHQWAKDENFQFKLLSDHLHAVAREYASFNE
ncbi:MAG TPA: redoxin domain-containing protein, partial [Bacteroidota bacterium]|nr:redoxin domain-containing protein [Bacteroidota bacterium]